MAVTTLVDEGVIHESSVAIPMRDPELRSLNLSTSVALALYEAQRQWG